MTGESIDILYKLKGQIIPVWPLWESVKTEFVNKGDSDGFSTFGGPCVIQKDLKLKPQSYLSLTRIQAIFKPDV